MSLSPKRLAMPDTVSRAGSATASGGPDRVQLARTQVTLRPDAELLDKHRPQRALADAGYFAQVCQPQRTRLTLPSTSAMRAMICVRDALGRPMRGLAPPVPDTVGCAY